MDQRTGTTQSNPVSQFKYLTNAPIIPVHVPNPHSTSTSFTQLHIYELPACYPTEQSHLALDIVLTTFTLSTTKRFKYHLVA